MSPRKFVSKEISSYLNPSSVTLRTTETFIFAEMVLVLGSVQSCMATSNHALVSMPVHLQTSGAFNAETLFRNLPKMPRNGAAQDTRGKMACPTFPGIRAARRVAVLAKAAGEAPWASKPAARYVRYSYHSR